MPSNKFFNGDESILKTLLWKQMDDVLYDQALHEGFLQETDERPVNDPAFQVVDINFARKGNRSTAYLIDLHELQIKITKLEQLNKKKNIDNKDSKVSQIFWMWFLYS